MAGAERQQRRTVSSSKVRRSNAPRTRADAPSGSVLRQRPASITATSPRSSPPTSRKRPAASASSRKASPVGGVAVDVGVLGKVAACVARDSALASSTASSKMTAHGAADKRARHDQQQMQTQPNRAEVSMCAQQRNTSGCIRRAEDSTSAIVPYTGCNQPQRAPLSSCTALPYSDGRPPRTACVLTVDVVNGVATPTSEWRRVPRGVACPKGCEFRMDLESGVNLVRRAPLSTQVAGGSAVGSQRPISCDAIHRKTNDSAVVVDSPPRTRQLSLKEACKSQHGHPGRPSPPISQTALVPVASTTVVPAGRAGSAITPSGYQAVERQQRKSSVATGRDGSRQEMRLDVKSRELYRPGETGEGASPLERRTARRDERVHRMSDGRVVVTETLTLQKVTYLKGT
eukprot:TRINITY_DN68376_c0_g1_i1.p1 TRINITY_DN68376_c0_g1~~TRINITY_DN68376_c0_g1_i1.p1  ORF type:complete len:402 (-),score=38.56 TRINITY_DN68376_c0_g1_i1:121-1326(-)